MNKGVDQRIVFKAIGQIVVERYAGEMTWHRPTSTLVDLEGSNLRHRRGDRGSEVGDTTVQFFERGFES